MKTNKIKITMLLATILMTMGCSESFLEVENKNSLLDDAFETPEGLRQYEIGMFNSYKGMYNYFWTCYLTGLTNEYVFHHTGGEGQEIREWSDLNPKPTNSFGGFLYGSQYNTIRMANIILEVGEILADDRSDMSDEEYNRILGAAYFMRAVSHFQLMSVWGKSFETDDKWGIVIQTKPVVDRAGFQIARSKPSEVYTQIIADFVEAQKLLPLEGDLPTSYLGHPSREAATAFLGKMYLIQKDYTAAKNEFEKFFQINPSKGLLPNFGDNFHGMFENGKESVFEVQFSDAINLPNTWGGGAGRPYQEFMGSNGLGRNNVLVPEYFMEKFETNDFRKIETAFSMDVDTYTLADGGTYIHIDSLNNTLGSDEAKRYEAVEPVIYGPKKYINKNRNNLNSGGKESYACNENEIIMRVAEVYMMYAETLAETGDLNGAFDYLNKVRRRAFGYDPAVYSTSPYDFAVGSKDDFYTNLYEETIKEFIGENVIWFKWKRWGIVEEEVAKTGRTFIVGTHEAMPIPDGEIRTDQLVEQNPGY